MTKPKDKPKGRLLIHVAAGVSWWDRTKLVFFHDEHFEAKDDYKKWQKRKPRRNRRPYKAMNEQDFNRALDQWEAEKPIYETLPKSIVMTNKYYTDHILPSYRELYNTTKYRRPGG